MNSKDKIWVALDTDKGRAFQVANKVADHSAVFGFKVNRLVDEEVFRKDNEVSLFDELSKHGLPIWVDLKIA